MTSYDAADLHNALKNVGLPKGALTLVHSSLFALGPMTGCAIDEIPAQIYQTIRARIGSDATIVVPTFNFDFCRGQLFDRQDTPSKKMGSFAEFIRTSPGAHRSSHPLQSVAALGPLANKLTKNNTTGAFEPGSSFDLLVEKNAHILLLGCGFEPISLIHWAEERAQVPYRFWKEFEGPYRDKGHEERRVYRLFARDLELDPAIHLAPIKERMILRDELQSAPLGRGVIQRCQARHFARAALELLSEDPFALVLSSQPKDKGEVA